MIIMRIATILVILIGAVSLAITRPIYVSSVKDETDDFVEADNLVRHVRYLSEEAIPRSSKYPENLDKAAEYIKQELLSFTNEVSFQNYDVNNIGYKNVIASFGPDTDEVIVVGAHYDAFLRLPGADDNASGVAGLIELGRLLQSTELQHQVLLVAYSLEEPPHFAGESMGSYVHASSIENKKIKMMISLEMIGYFSDEPNSQSFPVSVMKLLYPTQGNYIAIVDKFRSNDAVGLKSAINKYTELPAYSINAPRSIVGIDFSDHRSYWAFGHPAVMVTDTSFYRNKAYHTKRDTYDRLNYQLMAKVVFGVFKYVQELSLSP